MSEIQTYRKLKLGNWGQIGKLGSVPTFNTWHYRNNRRKPAFEEFKLLRELLGRGNKP